MNNEQNQLVQIISNIWNKIHQSEWLIYTIPIISSLTFIFGGNFLRTLGDNYGNAPECTRWMSLLLQYYGNILLISGVIQLYKSLRLILFPIYFKREDRKQKMKKIISLQLAHVAFLTKFLFVMQSILQDEEDCVTKSPSIYRSSFYLWTYSFFFQIIYKISIFSIDDVN